MKLEEIEEQQKERKLKKEIEKLKEKLGRRGKEPRNKKPKLEIYNKLIDKISIRIPTVFR